MHCSPGRRMEHDSESGQLCRQPQCHYAVRTLKPQSGPLGSKVKERDTKTANKLEFSRGIGGLFWIPMIYFWGRAPVLFWTTVAGTFFTLGCCLTTSFTTFYGLRALMGFTLTAAQTIGLSYIKDMFFFHEHARKIGLWAGLFLLSPYCGPLFGNFIIAGTGSWRNVFWLVFAICAFTSSSSSCSSTRAGTGAISLLLNSPPVGPDCCGW